MTAYFCWLIQILVPNAAEFKNESKQKAGYILACCTAVAPSSPYLAGFVVQSLLAVSLGQLTHTEVGSWECLLCLAPSQDPTQKLGWTRLRRLLIFLGIIFLLFKSSHCTPLNMCLVGPNTSQSCLTASTSRPAGLS